MVKRGNAELYSWWERLDWLWNGLTLVFLAISLSLIADAVPRFLSGGLDKLRRI